MPLIANNDDDEDDHDDDDDDYNDDDDDYLSLNRVPWVRIAFSRNIIIPMVTAHSNPDPMAAGTWHSQTIVEQSLVRKLLRVREL